MPEHVCMRSTPHSPPVQEGQSPARQSLRLMGSIKSLMLKTHSKGENPLRAASPIPPPANTCSPNPFQCQRKRRKSEAGFGGVLLLINSPFQAFPH